MAVQKHVYQTRELERGVFQQLHDPSFAWSRTNSVFSRIPGVLAAWSGASSYSNGLFRVMPSLTGFGDLIFSGAHVFGSEDNSVVPILSLPGAAYANTIDAQFDITGTESYIASGRRGLTVGGWFKHVNAPTASQEIMFSNRGSASVHSFSLHRAATTGLATFYVSGNGATLASVTGQSLDEDEWYFVVGTYKPSTYIRLYVNGVMTENTTSIPASLYVGTGYFTLGAFSTSAPANGLNMFGRFSGGFVCHMAVDEQFIWLAYQSTKAMFGL